MSSPVSREERNVRVRYRGTRRVRKSVPALPGTRPTFIKLGGRCSQGRHAPASREPGGVDGHITQATSICSSVVYSVNVHGKGPGSSCVLKMAPTEWIRVGVKESR